MTPQLVDLNGDGIQDMVMATYEGTAFWIQGTKEGWKNPTYLVDENDTHVRISTYVDMESREITAVDRSSDDYKSNGWHRLTSIALVDWDQDGDQDLILGAYEGALYRCMNIGSKTEPKFAAINHQIKADGKPVSLDGLTTPRVVDWNGDGLFDILCGGTDGGVFYYRNVGEKGEPEFASSQELISANVGYDKMDVPVKDGMVIGPGTSLHMEAVDYDGDGDLDLLVGARSYRKGKGKKLSEEEEEELKEILKEMEENEIKMSALYDSVKGDPDKKRKMLKSDEYNALNAPYNKLYSRKRELKPPVPAPADLIWLYRNKKVSNRATEATSSSPRIPATESDEAKNHGTTPKVDPALGDFLSRDLKVRASVQDRSDDGTATLVLLVNVPEGFHIYGARSRIEPTSVSLKQTDGVQTVGEPGVPGGRLVMDGNKSGYWLTDVVTITQQVKLDQEAESISGELAFMICDKNGCKPPATEAFSVTLKSARKQ